MTVPRASTMIMTLGHGMATMRLAPEPLADCWLLRVHLRPTTGMVDSLRSFASSWYLHKE